MLKQSGKSETAYDSDGKCACGKFRLPRVGRATETFCDFYTSKKSPAARKTRSEEARASDADDSGAKVQQNSKTANESEGNLLHIEVEGTFNFCDSSKENLISLFDRPTNRIFFVNLYPL